MTGAAVLLTESQFGAAPLNRDQAAALEEVGAKLATSGRWWGEDHDKAEGPTRSLVRCQKRPSGGWAVRVDNAVGALSIDDVELVIQPKIPSRHFLYLLQRANELPRHGEAAASLEASPDLWRLVAHWYIATLEQVIRLGLIRDYAAHTDALTYARGSIQPRATITSYYAGRTELICTYDRFGIDSPANRVLRAAARAITASPSLPWPLRRRARAASEALDGAADLQPADLPAAEHVRDRRLAHYRPALNLAAQVLRNLGRNLAAGEHTVWTFLLPTPPAVEKGIRAVLREHFGSAVAATGSRTVAGVSFNPDILFPSRATADVKYRLAGRYWDRSALYQAIAFAAAFEVTDGAVFDFATTRTERLPDAAPGQFRIRQISWPAGADVTPDAAATEFVNSVDVWLESQRVR